MGIIGKNLKEKLVSAGATSIMRPFISNKNSTCLVLTHVKQLNDYHITVIDSKKAIHTAEKNANELPEEAFSVSFYLLPSLVWEQLKAKISQKN